MLKSKKLLLLGPKSSSHSQGGVTVLFENFLEQLNLNKVDHIVFDTNMKNHSNYASFLSSLLFIIFNNRKEISGVSLHGTNRDYDMFSFILPILKKIFRWEYTLRKFGGNYDELFTSKPFFMKFFISILLENSNGSFFESKKLVSFFSKKYNKIFWFPNVRNLNVLNNSLKNKSDPMRLVFISQIYRSKGVFEAIKAVNLHGDVSLDIYGPLIDVNKDEILNYESSTISYKGPIEAASVLKVLSEYDALVFPTYYEGEGYPGVVIESLSVGTPVIASSWNAIPEMFNDKSLLCTVGDVDDLVKKINKLNVQYSKYQNLTSSEVLKFSPEQYTDKLLTLYSNNFSVPPSLAD